MMYFEIKNNIQILKSYFRNKKDKVAETLINILDKVHFDDINDGMLFARLSTEAKLTKTQCDEVISKIREAKGLNRDQINEYRRGFESAIYSNIIREAQQSSSNSIEFVDAIKKFDYKKDSSEVFKVTKLKDIKVSKIKELYDVSKCVKSRYNFINQSFVVGGYQYGQIICVCGAPSTGKSLFLQSEALNMALNGVKCHYLCMGDLNEEKIMSRLAGMYCQVSQKEFMENIEGYVLKTQADLNDNLDITCQPSGKTKAREHIDWCLDHINDYDVFFVDYDTNYEKDPHAESMYEELGAVYDMFTEITSKGKLVFVACQPKNSAYKDEKISMDSLAESSRKSQIIDMCITLGRYKNNVCGIASIEKNRNGENMETPWLRTVSGTFFEANEAMYAALKEGYKGDRVLSANALNNKLKDFLSFTEMPVDNNSGQANDSDDVPF